MSLDIYLVCPHCEQPFYTSNITHNLNTMADKAGIYKALWRPEEIPITTAAELAALLEPAIRDMAARKEYFQQFDSENGWGLYEHFMPFLRKLLEACLEHPTAKLEVSR